MQLPNPKIGQLLTCSPSQLSSRQLPHQHSSMQVDFVLSASACTAVRRARVIFKVYSIPFTYELGTGTSEKAEVAQQGSSPALSSRGAADNVLPRFQTTQQGDSPIIRLQIPGDNDVVAHQHMQPSPQQAPEVSEASSFAQQAQTANEPGMQMLGTSVEASPLQQSSSQIGQDAEDTAKLPSAGFNTPVVEHLSLPSPERKLSNRPSKRRSLQKSRENRANSRKLGQHFLQKTVCFSCSLYKNNFKAQSATFLKINLLAMS